MNLYLFRSKNGLFLCLTDECIRNHVLSVYPVNRMCTVHVQQSFASFSVVPNGTYQDVSVVALTLIKPLLNDGW